MLLLKDKMTTQNDYTKPKRTTLQTALKAAVEEVFIKGKVQIGTDIVKQYIKSGLNEEQKLKQDDKNRFK